MKLDGLTHWPGFIGCCNPLFMKLHGLQWLGFVLLRFESNKKLKIRVLNQIKMLSRLNVPDLYMYYIIEPDLHFFFVFTRPRERLYKAFGSRSPQLGRMVSSVTHLMYGYAVPQPLFSLGYSPYIYI